MVEILHTTDVTFRYLGIPYRGLEISGIVLWYGSRKNAMDSIRRFHSYLNSDRNTNRYLDIAFEKEGDGTFGLSVIIEIGMISYQTNIHGIDALYVKRIRDSLNEFPYYLITVGYTDRSGADELLPIRQYSFFRNKLLIDQEIIVGQKKNKWPGDLFQAELQEIRKEE